MSVAFPDNEYILVLPKQFQEKKDLLKWPSGKNIVYDASLPTREKNGANDNVFTSLKKSIGRSQEMVSYIKKYNPNTVISLDIMALVPFLPFLLWRNVNIVGIVYGIYLRAQKLNLRAKIANRTRYTFLSSSRLFGTVYILNDEKSAKELNRVYNTNKFRALPDPFVPIPENNTDIRTEYGISHDQCLFLHFGFLSEQKGTLDILRAIKRIDHDGITEYAFVFAGCVSESIRKEFYDLVNSIKNIKVIVKDEFCSYTLLSALCRSSNALLMPYHDNSKSSGVIGYASQFHVPVVAKVGGLLGEIIAKYKLGYLIPDHSEDSFLKAFSMIKDRKVASPSNDYCNSNNVDAFITTLRTDTIINKK